MITYRAYLFGFGIDVSFMLLWNYLVKVNELRYWQTNSVGFFSLYSQRNTVTEILNNPDKTSFAFRYKVPANAVYLDYFSYRPIRRSYVCVSC